MAHHFPDSRADICILRPLGGGGRASIAASAWAGEYQLPDVDLSGKPDA